MAEKPENPSAFPEAFFSKIGEVSRFDFAAKAMSGCLSYSYCNPINGNYHENSSPEGVAKISYEYADAMLVERSKP